MTKTGFRTADHELWHGQSKWYTELLCEEGYYKTVSGQDELTITRPVNGLLPGRRQAIIRNNAGILLIRTLGTNSSEILSGNFVAALMY